MKTVHSVGLDFGTTNSAIAVALGDDGVKLAKFKENSQSIETFRSILYFFHPYDHEVAHGPVAAGPEAVTAYLSSEPRGRLIQSMKSFLASRLFERTGIYRSFYGIEDLVALVVRELKAAAELQFGRLSASVVVGRPVRFSGAETQEDDLFALERLRRGVLEAGFEEVAFEFEPVAAAYRYEQQLNHDELVLIADFGGGTSDFSLLRLGPSMRAREDDTRQILGTDGVAIAGNDFDSVLVRHLVAPRLGLGTEYESMNKLLPVPAWIYKQFERWHYLSFLKTRETIEMLERIQANALEPERIGNLIQVIEDELGFELYQAIEATKIQLSKQPAAVFTFSHRAIDIHERVTRQDFETWIGPYLTAMRNCIDRLLQSCSVAPSEVDSVFMTGGSSFVPAVRKLFEDTFGPSRLRGGGELTSVAEGLGLRALRRRG
jgi:hypothetical chaperone protein